MTCDDVNGLIDLYACEACDPAQTRAVREHLVECEGCRESLAEARQLQGMLTLHFGQEESLKRLEARLRREARSGVVPRRILPFAKRFAAVAALLLVVFGLGAILAPTARPPSPALPLQLALVVPHRDRGPKAMRIERDHLQAPGSMEAAVQKAKVTGDWPLPPEVDLVARLSNPTASPMTVEIGGPNFRCSLDVRGPGDVIVEPIDDPKFVPFAQRSVTVAAGKTVELPITRLASQNGGRVKYLYPSKPGGYTLRARLEAVVHLEGGKRTVYLITEPVAVRVP